MATNGIVQVAQATAAAASSSSAPNPANNANGSSATMNTTTNGNNVNAKHQMTLINAISQAFRNQMGEPMQNDKIASLLLQHMGQLGELAKQGKLNYSQIMQASCICFLTLDVT